MRIRKDIRYQAEAIGESRRVGDESDGKMYRVMQGFWEWTLRYSDRRSRIRESSAIGEAKTQTGEPKRATI